MESKEEVINRINKRTLSGLVGEQTQYLTRTKIYSLDLNNNWALTPAIPVSDIGIPVESLTTRIPNQLLNISNIYAQSYNRCKGIRVFGQIAWLLVPLAAIGIAIQASLGKGVQPALGIMLGFVALGILMEFILSCLLDEMRIALLTMLDKIDGLLASDPELIALGREKKSRMFVVVEEAVTKKLRNVSVAIYMDTPRNPNQIPPLAVAVPVVAEAVPQSSAASIQFGSESAKV